MAIFNSYVSLPEGMSYGYGPWMSMVVYQKVMNS